MDRDLYEAMKIMSSAQAVPRLRLEDDFPSFAAVQACSEEDLAVAEGHSLLLQEQDALAHEGINATSELIDQFCQLIARGLSRPSACKQLGIDKRHMANAWAWYRKGQPEKPPANAPPKEALRWSAHLRHWNKLDSFFTAVGAEEAKLEGRLLDPQVKAATHPDTPDLKVGQWLLERRFSQQWGKVSQVKHEGKPDVGGTTNHVRITQNVIATGTLTDEQLEIMEKAHQASASVRHPQKLAYDV